MKNSKLPTFALPRLSPKTAAKLTALSIAVSALFGFPGCSNSTSPTNIPEVPQFNPSVGNHGGINFFIQEGVDRDAFLADIQLVLTNPQFTARAPFISNITRTLSGDRVITIDSNGRAVIYTSTGTSAELWLDIVAGAAAALEYQNANTAQNIH